MSETVVLPHIYYTISELSSIKDVGALKNLNVKIMGYIRDDQAFEIDFERRTFEKLDKWIQLDLRHVTPNIPEMKPHIIFGLLYSVNQSLALCVKSLRQFDADFEHLIVYHHLLLSVRKKSDHFKELKGEEELNKVNR